MKESNLSISIENLLNQTKIESDRIEFKLGWNPDSIYRSICAFANDFDNIGGGYILIGVEEKDGKAVRPVKGLDDSLIAKIQKEMIGFNNLIRPYYAPRLSIEVVDNERIIALWVAGGVDRPYEVPEFITSKDKHFKFFIRRYASNIEAKGRDKEELFSLNNQIPFDDRFHKDAKIEDLNLVYIQDYLRISGSRLFEQAGKIPAKSLLKQLDLIAGPDENIKIKNVALMLFTDSPEKFFPYSYIDIVHFKGKTSGRTFTETRCTGPMQVQIKQALDYLRSHLIQEKVTKISGQAEARRAWNYPFDALEEAVVNAVYHRDYSEREPITIRIETDRILIYNCGGPDRSIKIKDLQKGTAIASRYRNRRLGDFLKEMELTEGRSTGLSLIHSVLSKNGSPIPLIETDEQRSFFRVIFKIHPEFKVEDVQQLQPKNLGIMVERLKTLIDESDQAGDQASDQASDQAEKMVMILRKLKLNTYGKEELLIDIGLSNHTKNVRRYIDPLEKLNLIEKTIPNKPTSPNQEYRLTVKGENLLD